MVGFLLNQLGRWETTDFEYDFINLIGSAILAVYASQIGAWPFVILFVVWALFSLKDVVVDGFKNRGAKKKVVEVKKDIKENIKVARDELDVEHNAMENEKEEGTANEEKSE